MKHAADLQPAVEVERARTLDWAGAIGLFLLLAAYSVSTFDDAPLQRYLLGAISLVSLTLWLCLDWKGRLRYSVPAICVLLMATYGAAQTLWFPQKIVFYGWTKTCFWYTAALLTLTATQIFRFATIARQFRLALSLFASAVCLLDLLQQASHTNKYFWLFQSKWPLIYGTFAYHNNFAQLVELSLPVTLWIGIGHRKPNPPFLLLAALQVGATAAASTRSGLALVIAEVLVVAALCYRRQPQPAIALAAGATLVLSLAFVFIAGFEGVAAKLGGDQLLVRRDFNKSSLAMIEQKPLTGWGMGAYRYVYPKFARFDDTTYVNQAHNDWLEWTAEGGIFFTALMLIVFVWSIAPAVRSIWGIGLIALCLNAAVDYPFARLGVCGWYFALAGMLAAQISRKSSTPQRFRGLAPHRSLP